MYKKFMWQYVDGGKTEGLLSFTSDGCTKLLLEKGCRLFKCSRSGNGKIIVDKFHDCFGNLLILNSVVLEDCVVKVDVMEDYPLACMACDEVYTPYIRQAIKAADYDPCTEARILNRYHCDLVKFGSLKKLQGITIACPGDFEPIVPDGYIAITNYIESGTKYELVPINEIDWYAPGVCYGKNKRW